MKSGAKALLCLYDSRPSVGPLPLVQTGDPVLQSGPNVPWSGHRSIIIMTTMLLLESSGAVRTLSMDGQWEVPMSPGSDVVTRRTTHCLPAATQLPTHPPSPSQLNNPF